MPTKQVIYPTLWTGPRLLGCPVEAHLAYAYLRPLADHWGCFEWASAWPLAGRRPEITPERLEGWLHELELAGALERHEVDGVVYGRWVEGSGIPVSQRCPPRLPELTDATRVDPPSRDPVPEAQVPPPARKRKKRTPVTPDPIVPPEGGSGVLAPFSEDWAGLRKTKIPNLARIGTLIKDTGLPAERVRLVWRDWLLNAPKPANVKTFCENYGELERRVVIGA